MCRSECDCEANRFSRAVVRSTDVKSGEANKHDSWLVAFSQSFHWHEASGVAESEMRNLFFGCYFEKWKLFLSHCRDVEAERPGTDESGQPSRVMNGWRT
jgi:hypothetical protein